MAAKLFFGYLIFAIYKYVFKILMNRVMKADEACVKDYLTST